MVSNIIIIQHVLLRTQEELHYLYTKCMFRHRQCNSAYMCICKIPPCYYMLHSNDKAGYRIHSDLKEMHYIYFQLGIFAGLFSSARE